MKSIYKLLVPFASIVKNYPEQVLSLRYRWAQGRKIDLKNPKLFYDKIIWLSLNTDTSLWSKLADKYEVRDFVRERYDDSILNKLYGIYDSISEINYDELPNQFVLKTTNSCATNVIVKDKTKLNIKETNRQLDKWLKFPYGEITGQSHYCRIRPRIIAEQYLIQDKNNPDKSLIDYKFTCFNGKPFVCYVAIDRELNSHQSKCNLYDMNWVAHPQWLDKSAVTSEINPPASFEVMLQVCSKLSEGFPYVRVDLYEIDGKPVFGEMTFMPGLPGFSHEFQLPLGNMIKL